VELQGVLTDARDPEVLGFGAAGQHQLAIGQANPRVGFHGAGDGIDPPGPLLKAHDSPIIEELGVAGGNLPRLQFTAQQFIKER
jgi:hypothetical protein